MASERERVDLARRGIDAYTQGELEAALELLSPEIEVYSPPGTVNAGTYRGIDGFLDWTGRWNEAWERFEREIQAIEAVGDRHAIAVVNQRGVGRGSGVEVEQVAAYVFELDAKGQASYFALYNDVEEAFAATRGREGIA